ncbi:AraC family transcriptional regulator [Flavobacterium sufflavum]|uniref:AraC family transcriptional regulator n=1 Tax=Flavobacterium sufflavum TaxID=1921138 RepID=A0A437KLN1_9FLAO|nr:GyrI-like domain-containing protein [Flavobacterium sufflavum]RVT71734.1 AraC family transcriptional regulator [Flavobacterium sufflavum]
MKEDYIKRINNILIFIDVNLDQELNLETIANIGFYSPFHLHRIFKAITNETINEYITRKRIEKTASILLHKREISISELSLQYGFNSNSSFTRTFKKFYGISPTEFRKSNPYKFSKIGKVESKNGEERGILEEYICNINNHKNWIKMKAKIEIKEMPKLDLAFITQIGHNGMENTYAKLIKWATPKRLLENENLKVVTIYLDSFKITEPDKVRMSACISLKEKVEVSGEIGLTTIEKGKFIVGHFEIGINEFEKSWSSLFIWMSENGYKKADRNPYEIYNNNFNEHPEKISIVDFCIPIE